MASVHGGQCVDVHTCVCSRRPVRSRCQVADRACRPQQASWGSAASPAQSSSGPAPSAGRVRMRPTAPVLVVLREGEDTPCCPCPGACDLLLVCVHTGVGALVPCTLSLRHHDGEIARQEAHTLCQTHGHAHFSLWVRQWDSLASDCQAILAAGDTAGQESLVPGRGRQKDSKDRWP